MLKTVKFLEKKQISKNICKACAYMRIQAGVSQKEIADSLGLHQTSISQFENGINDSMTIYLEYLSRGLV